MPLILCLMAAWFTVVSFLMPKAMWSGELSEKCAAVIYVWIKELHINVRLNQTVRLMILQNIQWCSFKNFKGKSPQDCTIVCWHDEVGDWHR